MRDEAVRWDRSRESCEDAEDVSAATTSEPDMKTYAIAAIPGDGIGTEVIAAGVEVLAALAKRDGGFASSSIISTGAATTTRSTAA